MCLALGGSYLVRAFRFARSRSINAVTSLRVADDCSLGFSSLRCPTPSLLNPDSAVAIDRKREAQPFRSQVDGFLPLTRHRLTVPGEDTKRHRYDVRECKNDFETSQSDAFAASGFRLASDIFG